MVEIFREIFETVGETRETLSNFTNEEIDDSIQIPGTFGWHHEYVGAKEEGDNKPRKERRKKTKFAEQ